MKYIKTFEKSVTLNITDKEEIKLMEYALDNEVISIVKSLLDNKFNPNTLIDGDSMLTYYIYGRNINYDIIKLLLDYGADVNLKVNDNPPIILSYAGNYTKNNNSKEYIELFRLFLKYGAKLFVEDEDGLDFFETIEMNSSLNKKTKKEILNIVKEESPEQYQEYISRLTAKKYNL